MNTTPGEGERRAISGYEPQYLVGAELVKRGLANRDLEWLRVADPEAGRVDDLQLAHTARIDAYQVKWKQYGGNISFNDLIKGNQEEPALIAQLADGWQRLTELYPTRRIRVHLVTNASPSPTAKLPEPKTASKRRPYHLAAFIEQEWYPKRRSQTIDLTGEWEAVWELLCEATNLSIEEFQAFILDCYLDFNTQRPEDNDDIKAIVNLLLSTAGDPEQRIELKHDELLQRLGWQTRYAYRNKHEFPAPTFLYQPIQSTVREIESAVTSLPGGYIGVFGAPGSGKSTLLTQTLRSLRDIVLLRYYAYVPDSQDASILRGESINFLQDITLRLQDAGIGKSDRPDPKDRIALLSLFHEQLQKLGENYQQKGLKAIILIDGLDHIEREQNPERSFLEDLPQPSEVPDGVYIILGSQTEELALPPAIKRLFQQHQKCRIEMSRLTPSDINQIARETIPILSQEELQQVYQLSDGHPLTLIYLLKQLQQLETAEERSQLLEEAVPYKNDIEEQYWAHWLKIEEDEPLTHTLGLLARVRGRIPMEWVARWAKETLRQLRDLFLTYFQEEGQNHWVFFHNSFRLFLIEKTRTPLPGQTEEQLDQEYHRELAKYYEQSPEPWQWEALFHWYRSGNYSTVVEKATFEWFGKQVEALRPIDAVKTDVRLTLKAAGHCKNVIALIKLTLVGSGLEQRERALEESELPELLIELGELTQGVECLRDGNRLRLHVNAEERSLQLSIRLLEAGLEREGERIFELAEPLELLAGQPITEGVSPSYNYEIRLLHEWVKSAIVFRGVKEVIEKVRCIRIDVQDKLSGLRVSDNQQDESEQETQDLQKWLLLQGALTCLEKDDDLSGWKAFLNAFDLNQDRKYHFAFLLNSVEMAFVKDKSLAHSLLKELLTEFDPSELDGWYRETEQFKARLKVTQLVIFLTEQKEIAQTWIKGLRPLPLNSIDGLQGSENRKFCQLQFKYAQVCYLLGDTRLPIQIRDKAESLTRFSSNTEEESKKSYRQLTLAMFTLAQLWQQGYTDLHLQPKVFLQQI